MPDLVPSERVGLAERSMNWPQSRDRTRELSIIWLLMFPLERRRALSLSASGSVARVAGTTGQTHVPSDGIARASATSQEVMDRIRLCRMDLLD